MSNQTAESIPEEPLTRTERLRRVVRVCGYFMQSLAYYRAAWSDSGAGKKELRGRNTYFWRHANGTFVDFAVLEWCKLFGDKKAKHHWSKIVSDSKTFESELLRYLGIDSPAFDKYIDGMRHYRDKFVAHLDSAREMKIPDFAIAKAAIEFYHKYIVEKEIQNPEELEGLVTDLDSCYQEATEEGQRIYEKSGI